MENFDFLLIFITIHGHNMTKFDKKGTKKERFVSFLSNFLMFWLWIVIKMRKKSKFPFVAKSLFLSQNFSNPTKCEWFVICFLLSQGSKIFEKERKRNEKGTRVPFEKEGTEHERVPQNWKRNEEGIRSSKKENSNGLRKTV